MKIYLRLAYNTLLLQYNFLTGAVNSCAHNFLLIYLVVCGLLTDRCRMSRPPVIRTKAEVRTKLSLLEVCHLFHLLLCQG